MSEHFAPSYAEFEGVMLELARVEGWEFEFDGKPVSTASVFSEATFGPPLLRAAQAELQARGIAQDLGLAFEADNQAMFACRVRFDEGRNSILAGIWRLAQCGYLVGELPRNAHRICLDLVPAALAVDMAPEAPTVG